MRDAFVVFTVCPCKNANTVSENCKHRLHQGKISKSRAHERFGNRLGRIFRDDFAAHDLLAIESSRITVPGSEGHVRSRY
jgi:hypothetical protein